MNELPFNGAKLKKKVQTLVNNYNVDPLIIFTNFNEKMMHGLFLLEFKNFALSVFSDMPDKDITATFDLLKDPNNQISA